MNEKLLQFIWQYSLYQPSGLMTTEGEALTVIHPGTLNQNAGPDFENARIRIGNTTLAGNIELHIHTSDWKKHGHEKDQSYQNIILHVVFKDDEPQQVTLFPKLELKGNLSAHTIEQYTDLIQTTKPIACSHQLAAVNPLTKESWLTRLLAERWEQKLGEWKDLLDESAGDWRNLLYWRMAANFGFKTNSTPFLLMARSLPLNVLARHKDNLLQIEALLFGQAGMLHEKFKEEYPRQLQAEYKYLGQKYQLSPIQPHLWKFMRMRPPNFPTIRLAQFAMLIHRSVHLFSKIIDTCSEQQIQALFQVKASEYWDTHFRFGDQQMNASVKSLGKDSVENIIINTIAPIRFLYARHQGSDPMKEQALNLLGSILPERNKFITLWEEQGWKADNAAGSQALLQLYNHYCAPKRCLECAVGLSIIKKAR